MATGTSPNTNPSDYYFQLMPDRRDVTYSTENGEITTHGYWFTWTPAAGLHKAMSANAIASGKEYGTFAISDFNYADSATKQMFIIISEDELLQWREVNGTTGIRDVNSTIEQKHEGKFLENGRIVIYKEGKRFNLQGGRIW
jgi:hypothetical protein